VVIKQKLYDRQDITARRSKLSLSMPYDSPSPAQNTSGNHLRLVGETPEQGTDGLTVEVEDTRKDYGEKRIICYGLLAGRMVVVGDTPRGHGAPHF
jgi:uncharacterized DUF497 family protein